MTKVRQEYLKRFAIGLLAFMVSTFASNTDLRAHPHVWIQIHNAITFDDDKRIVSVEAYWRFDEFYSAFAIQGLDANKDGKYSPSELAILLKDNLEDMSKANYYTQTLVDGAVQRYASADNPQVFYEDGLLSMRFTLKLATPVEPKGKTINISTFDPTYYIAMDLSEQQPASILGTKPKACELSIKRPDQSEPANLDDAIATTDAKLALSYAQQYASQILIKCAS